MLDVTQRQRAVAPSVHVPHLHVRFAVAQVVLRGQLFTNRPVARLIVDGRHQQLVLLIVVQHAEQTQIADHLG